MSCGVSTGAGWKTLAVCGAKTGDEVQTSRVGPSATTSPSAITMVREVAAAANSTSWVLTSTDAPSVASRSRIVRRCCFIA